MIPAIALTLAVVAVTWVVWIDSHDGRRLDELEGTLDDALAALDRAVVRISYLEERETPESAFPQVNLEEPATLPLTIVRGVPSDTAPGIAAVGAAVRQVFDDDAHTRGRHAHREGVDA